MSFPLLIPAASVLASLALLQAPVPPPGPRLHESVVVTAAAEPVPFDTAGRAVWVLTRDEIARLPVRGFDDLLRFASSVDVRSRGPYVQSDISIRGGNFGQTLVLIDGIRINDAQSGHHNTDLPLTLDDIERVEVLLGGGSSLFGADALAGTVNVITRSAAQGAQAGFVAGDFGLAGAHARAAVGGARVRQTFSVEAVRSSGFDVDRDFENVAVSGRTTIGSATHVVAGFVRRDFGANGFYGPAESRETTDQALAAVTRTFAASSWRGSVQAQFRSHGDRFLYDRTRPGAVPNEHRTRAATAVARASRPLGAQTRLTAGAEAGGDWIDSNNLGVRSFGRGSLFAELQQRLGDKLTLYPGLRYDAYSQFGDAWSPSIAARLAARPGLSVRGSVGHAFRVPTFTELYYRDPNHEARDDLRPERGWGIEAGVDWTPSPRTLVRATVFSRHDRDVIDWTRVSPAERWRTMNVRRVGTTGVEVGGRRLLGGAGWVDVQYTHLDTDAATLTGLLSKYVLEFAPHNLVVGGSARLPFAVDVAPRIGWTSRNDGRSYAVVDLRASRRLSRVTLFVDAANLFDQSYYEVVGVTMPGRWVSGGIRVGGPAK